MSGFNQAAAALPLDDQDLAQLEALSNDELRELALDTSDLPVALAAQRELNARGRQLSQKRLLGIALLIVVGGFAFYHFSTELE